jgi:hypothetical protein
MESADHQAVELLETNLFLDPVEQLVGRVTRVRDQDDQRFSGGIENVFYFLNQNPCLSTARTGAAKDVLVSENGVHLRLVEVNTGAQGAIPSD